MSPQLRQEVRALPEEAWQPWAEVPYVPARRQEKNDLAVALSRYLAIRVRPAQGELFPDGERVWHFAVVSNRWDLDGQALLEWQRGKAGTVEHVHHVLLNELGAGVYPSDKFGANAAWLRLQVLTHNLLEVLKAAVLPAAYRRARPKKLRFAVFTQWGWVVRHAGRTLVRITNRALEELIGPGRRRLQAWAWAGG